MKRFSPQTLTFAVVTIFICGIASFPQVTLDLKAPDLKTLDLKPYSAEVRWTEYKISSQKLSIQFPKLPVVQKQADLCSETDGASYFAYAGGVVYEFSWHAKSKTAIPDFCPTKTKFSKDLFTRRIKELKDQQWGYAESDTTLLGIPATLMRSTGDIGSVVITRWLVWEKDRWLEFGITRRKDTVVNEAQFSNGLKLSSSKGVDVKDGAEATYGDPDTDSYTLPEGKTRIPLSILVKPRPAYTKFARETNVQGAVRLRVTFLRNGGIGSISVVSGLPAGLTEQAIAAARKITFLPATWDGKPLHVSKQVEYSFSIY